MAEIQQQTLEGYILSGIEHTYREICDHFQASPTGEMQIDRTLQKLRRAGKIKKTRERRAIYWVLVPANPAAPTVE